MPDNLAPTTTPPPDPAELVDREAIAEADRVRNATLAKDADARRQLAVAEAAMRRAVAAADAAAAAKGFDLASEQAAAGARFFCREVQADTRRLRECRGSSA